MNYSQDTRPAKIINVRTLNELRESVYLTKDGDTSFFSVKRTENNIDRCRYALQTSDINITPTIRMVSLTNGRKNYASCVSFLVEPKDRALGVAIVSFRSDDGALYCNTRILPLNTLMDVAVPEADSKLLTVELQRSKCVLKTDIMLSPSNTGEALYSVHDVDVNAISDLVTASETIELKRELEFQGTKLIAHFLQDMMESLPEGCDTLTFKGILGLASGDLTKFLLGATIMGSLCLEIVGANVIKDLNRDWTSAGAFIGYLL